MMNGTLCIPVRQDSIILPKLQRGTYFPEFRAVKINGSNFTNAGAEIVKELALAYQWQYEYLDQLTDRKITPGKSLQDPFHLWYRNRVLPGNSKAQGGETAMVGYYRRL